MHCAHPPPDEHQAEFLARHFRLGVWILLISAAAVTLRAGVDAAGIRWAFLAPAAAVVLLILGGTTLSMLDALPAGWRLGRRPGIRRLLFGGVGLAWVLLLGLATLSGLAADLYPVGCLLLVAYACPIFPGRAVLGFGAAAIAGYLGLSAAGLPDPRAASGTALVTGTAVGMAATVLVCSMIARNRERLHRRQHHGERRTEVLLENSSDAVLAVNRDRAICYQSPSTSRLLGYPAGALSGTHLLDLVDPAAAAPAERWLAGLFLAPVGVPCRLETRLARSDGGWADVEIIGTNRTGDPDLDAAVLSVRDVSTRRQLEARLRQQALHDPLTGLANRALFDDRIRHAVARGRRTSSVIALILVDLDGFKLINDSLGHAAGDRLLVAVADRLRAFVRSGDTIARLGGDEFAVLVEDRIDEMAAHDLADRLLSGLRAPVLLDGQQVRCDASIGVAVAKTNSAGGDPPDAEELLRNADLAMYAAKSAGRSRVVEFDPAMHEQVLLEAEHRAELERGLAEDQFTVFYQPIVDLSTQRLTGVEALVRWNHPTRGFLLPAAFISLAESTGLIVPLGRWVLREACAQVHRWHEAVPEAADLHVSINLSARQFQDQDLVGDVAAALRHSGIAPEQVILEITESMLMNDTEATARTLDALKALGVHLAIDDFGTGYSSLSYLKRFPVDILKIDRSFVDDIAADAEHSTLAEAVVHLGRALRLQTVAEGIETTDQARRLRSLGCEYGQGYLFARPAAAIDVEAAMRGTREP